MPVATSMRRVRAAEVAHETWGVIRQLRAKRSGLSARGGSVESCALITLQGNDLTVRFVNADNAAKSW